MPDTTPQPAPAIRRRALTVAIAALVVLGAGVAMLLRARSAEGPVAEVSTNDATSPLAPATFDARGLASDPGASARRAKGATTPESSRATVVLGHVLDPDGKPLAGAAVRWEGLYGALDRYIVVRSVEPSSAVRTREDGSFSIDVPASPTNGRGLEACTPGYGRARADVNPLDAPRDVRIRLGDGAVLRGIARTADGKAVPSVFLRIGEYTGHLEGPVDNVRGILRISATPDARPFGHASDESQVADVTTDAGGRFTVRGVLGDSARILDCDWAYMVQRSSGSLDRTVESNEVTLVPAACVAVHVRSAVDDTPLSPGWVDVDLSNGDEGGTRDIGSDFAIRWPLQAETVVRAARVVLGADGFFPESFVVHVPKGARRSDATLRMRPLPKGPPASLRVRVQTSDAAFRAQEFHLTLREAPPSETPEVIDDEDPTPRELRPFDEFFQRVEGETVGDDVRFDGIPPGRWHVRVDAAAMWRDLDFAGWQSFVPGSESVATWVVPPHGWLRLEGDWAGVGFVTFTDHDRARPDAWLSTPSPSAPARFALFAGRWDASWLDGDKRFEASIALKDGCHIPLTRDAGKAADATDEAGHR